GRHRGLSRRLGRLAHRRPAATAATPATAVHRPSTGPTTSVHRPPPPPDPPPVSTATRPTTGFHHHQTHHRCPPPGLSPVGKYGTHFPRTTETRGLRSCRSEASCSSCKMATVPRTFVDDAARSVDNRRAISAIKRCRARVRRGIGKWRDHLCLRPSTT